MPSIAAHMVMAKLISDKLNINDDEFIKGNLYPDVILDSDSHHKIKGKYYLIPDINYFNKKYDFNNPFQLGCYTHLLLDKHFLEEYIPEKIKRLDVFDNDIIYQEYDYINANLVKNFSLDVKKYSKILKSLEELPNINIEKLERNIDYFNNDKSKETEYLKADEFSNFLNEISDVISEEIKNACKRYRMSLCSSK